MRSLPALLLLAVAAVWASSLGAGFVFDDWADVVENAAAQAATFLDRLPTTLRPLLKASYALQDWLHGPWAPGFHAGNVLLHVATTAVVLLLLRRLCGQALADQRHTPSPVMPGLDPGIQQTAQVCETRSEHWIAGSSPAMT
ncbi:MAG TPA: hypothetical protein VJL84_04465, partial [Kiloniellales bacterium]|nr:hypothetical protein [Kiloniellales bacterium]